VRVEFRDVGEVVGVGAGRAPAQQAVADGDVDFGADDDVGVCGGAVREEVQREDYGAV
jgi:hypothetical protein